MTSLHFLDQAQKRTALKKVTASLSSRPAARRALLALREAGYATREIKILRGIPQAALKEDGVCDLLSRYVRHLVSPKGVMIRVTAPNIDRAILLLRNLGAEVAVNQFFHQDMALSQPKLKAALPIRRWSE